MHRATFIAEEKNKATNFVSKVSTKAQALQGTQRIQLWVLHVLDVCDRPMHVWTPHSHAHPPQPSLPRQGLVQAWRPRWTGIFLVFLTAVFVVRNVT